ncbi:MAG: hypothetical protein HKN19_14980 [Halioglobus sp.]|nr:hypothetical protein [Halioglobus sp.]
MYRKTPANIAAPLSLALVLSIGATTGQTAPAAPEAEGTVTVDFSQSRGERLAVERMNNLTRAHRYVEQRDADVAFLNESGLHGEIYRVWVDAHKIRDPQKPQGGYDYSGIVDYLSDASRLSDYLLVVMDTRVEVRDHDYTPPQIKPVVKRILTDLKIRFPQIRYIETFNEPDHNMVTAVKAEDLYDYFVPYYEAVNEINDELEPLIPLEVGGPSLTTYSEDWMNAFLDDYAADPAPDKKLDFISWHAYGKFTRGSPHTEGPRAYHFYKGDPSEVASERKLLESALRSRGIDDDIPGFITETGIYPGPSFDHKDDPHADYVIQATGVPSLLYWYMEQDHIVPFNWVVRHKSEERKDQLITHVKNKPIPTGIFSPYGNSMVMMSKLKDERVVADSSTLENGRGVYAIATRDNSGVAIMLWNYQSTDSRAYAINIEMKNLPQSLQGKKIHQRAYKIDSETSNYWANPATADLQMVSEAVVKPGKNYSLPVNLTANALQLILMEPVK